TNIIPKAIRGPFIVSINLHSRTIPKVSRCTMYMLSQKKKTKTEDVGKKVGFLHIDRIPEIPNQ
ncbi:hypothetical protein ACFLZQ_07355, partial [Thermodesulfobacteriota bacterium]